MASGRGRWASTAHMPYTRPRMCILNPQNKPKKERKKAINAFPFFYVGDRTAQALLKFANCDTSAAAPRNNPTQKSDVVLAFRLVGLFVGRPAAFWQ